MSKSIDIGLDRPKTKILFDKIWSTIEDNAFDGSITAFEVMGVIDVISKKFYEDNLSNLDE